MKKRYFGQLSNIGVHIPVSAPPITPWLPNFQMITSLCSLPSLATISFQRGSGGHVFIISEHVVFKCPSVFDNPAPPQGLFPERMETTL